MHLGKILHPYYQFRPNSCISWYTCHPLELGYPLETNINYYGWDFLSSFPSVLGFLLSSFSAYLDHALEAAVSPFV